MIEVSLGEQHDPHDAEAGTAGLPAQVDVVANALPELIERRGTQRDLVGPTCDASAHDRGAEVAALDVVGKHREVSSAADGDPKDEVHTREHRDSSVVLEQGQ